ncbi:MAG: hypothetical protein K6E97_11085, partial [Treponema sp.]|nr:hypothetical protein [Treponema sp.]
MSNYNYFPNPTIRFFPRAKKYLFAEERKKTEDGKEEIVNKCELNDIIENYTDVKKYTLADKHFKTIEEKVYLDLSTYNSTTKTYKVSKKCCIGFLKQPEND